MEGGEKLARIGDAFEPCRPKKGSRWKERALAAGEGRGGADLASSGDHQEKPIPNGSSATVPHPTGKKDRRRRPKPLSAAALPLGVRLFAAEKGEEKEHLASLAKGPSVSRRKKEDHNVANTCCRTAYEDLAVS